MKKFMMLVCMIACLLSLTACGSEKEDSSSYNESQIQQITENMLSSFTQLNDEQMQQMIDADNSQVATDTDIALAIKSGLSAWLDSKEELGSFVSVEGFEMSSTNDTVTGTLNLVFEKRKADFSITYDSGLTKYTAIKLEPEYSMGEKFGKAGLNTLMGMGVVFVVLIFISFLISLFKYINKAEMRMAERSEKRAAKKAEKDGFVPKDVSKAPVVLDTVPEAEAVDDLELIAVITAAVAASMNTSVDNLVVRSVKRRKTNRWQ